ncbi:MAG: hypothetical protein ACI8RD_009067 [Bacillariaceae sp.]|jgi:hypothetical protein
MLEQPPFAYPKHLGQYPWYILIRWLGAMGRYNHIQDVLLKDTNVFKRKRGERRMNNK